MLRAAVIAIGLVIIVTPEVDASVVHPDWRAIAEAQVIVAAEPELSEKQFEQRISAHPASHIEMPVRVLQAIKGKPDSDSLKPLVYTGDAGEIQGLQSAYKSVTRILIAGLVTSDASGKSRFYLSRQWAATSEEDAALVVEGLQQEVARQQHILDNWKPDTTLSHFDKVKQIITKMMDPELQEKAFRELEALGEAAVPAIIHQMEDRRKLPHPYIALSNKSLEAFEEYRQYSPELVVDALAAILNQLTGAHFSSIYNGGTDIERDHVVAGWRIYDATVRGLPSPKEE